MAKSIQLRSHFSWAGLVLKAVNQYLKLPFLNQQKEVIDCRKYFMINLHKRFLPDPHTSLNIQSGQYDQTGFQAGVGCYCYTVQLWINIENIKDHNQTASLQDG